MKKLFLLLMMLSSAAIAESGDNHLILHGISHHTVKRERGPQWNETNPGIGIRHEFTENFSGQIGTYENSFYLPSTYVVGDYTPFSLGPIHFGAFLGVASGYTDKVGIAGGLLARWQGKKYSTTLRMIPGTKYQIYTLEIGYRF